MKYTIAQFRKDFGTDDQCLDFLFNARFGKDYACKGCKRTGTYYRVKGRKSYACSWCAKFVSPTAGTIFNKSDTPLSLWFHAMFVMSVAKNGVAATEIERHVGVSYKTALRMAHKIRSLMEQGGDMFTGTVEVDETYVGGRRHGKRGRGAAGKTAVFGISNRDTGRVYAKSVPNVRAATVMPLIKENVQIGSTVMTDEMASYKKSKQHGYDHHTVRHGAKEYVRGNVHTNSIEGFWSQLKRSIDGTHHAVSSKHLQKYLDEHVYRWNHRNDDVNLFSLLLERASMTA